MQNLKNVNLAKFPPYSLPRLYGWHMITKQELKDTGKVYKYFGANWWDLLLSGKLPLKRGEIIVKTKDAHAIIFINMGSDSVVMTNTHTGDTYTIMPGKRSTVNNTFDKEVKLTCSKPDSEMHMTKIGSIWLILLQIEQVRTGNSLIKNSDIFSDFLLMTGIPDKDQYLNTVGIESMDFFDTKGWSYIDTGQAIKSEFVELLLEQWGKVNPNKRTNAKEPIPRVIQWIWLRKDIRKDISKKEYGPLKPVFYKFMKSWIERNPGFEYNIWTDNPAFVVPKQFEGIITIKGPDEIDKLLNRLSKDVRKKIIYLYKNHPNPGARSDTLRQAILYLEGGVYSDINDGACLAPMEKMLEKFDYIIGMEPVVYVNNAIMASKKRHTISQAMLAWLASNYKNFVEEWKTEYNDAEQEEKDDYIVSTTGPIAMTQAIFGVMKKGLDKLQHSVFLPSSWVYPNYWIPESPEFWLKPVSITAHYDRRDYLK